jgi:hypothetical protein
MASTQLPQLFVQALLLGAEVFRDLDEDAEQQVSLALLAELRETLSFQSQN